MVSEYIKMRNQNSIDIQWLYLYAVSKGFTSGYDAFSHGVNYLDLTILLEQLDKEFNLTSLHDSKGRFIRIIT